MTNTLKLFMLVLLPILAAFFVIPFELYFNARQHWNWDRSLPIGFALAGAVLAVALLPLVAILSKYHRRSAELSSVVLFYVGLFVLMADVFSPLQATQLAGFEVTSPEPLGNTLREVALLLATILAAYHSRVRMTVQHGYLVSGSILAIALAYLGLIVLHPKPTMRYAHPSPATARIKGNVYHFVLDEMQTDAAQQLLEDSNLAEHFDGFTLYANNVSNYLYTYASFPSYMTGTLYQGRVPFHEWLHRPRDHGLWRELGRAGYHLTAYVPEPEFLSPHLHHGATLEDVYEQVTTDASSVTSSHLPTFFRIWLARLLPNVFTNEALVLGKDWGELLFPAPLASSAARTVPRSVQEGRMSFASAELMKRLIREESAAAAHGRYLYVHALIPHGPYLYRANGNRREDAKLESADRYIENAAYGLGLVAQFLTELQRLERYDDATIIIHADTGHGHRGFITRVAGRYVGTQDQDSPERTDPLLEDAPRYANVARAMALLMLKPRGATGGLAVSQAASQNIDIFPTLVDALGLEPGSRIGTDGISLLRDSPPPERLTPVFYFEAGVKNPKPRPIFILDQKNLRQSETRASDEVIEARARLLEDGAVETLDFDIGSGILYDLEYATFSGFESRALSPGESDSTFQWALGARSEFTLPLYMVATPTWFQLHLHVSPFGPNAHKAMVLKTPLSTEHVMLKPGWHQYDVTLLFPPGRPLEWEVTYATAQSPKELGISSDDRNLSVAWAHISLTRLQSRQGDSGRPRSPALPG
jgi:hypothetical protein